MRRRTMLPVLSLLGAGAAACGGSSNPKYFQEREGGEEVVGNQNPADRRTPAARSGDADATVAGRRTGGPAQPTQSRVVDDEVEAQLLPPVLERYDHIAERGKLLPSDCPEGTEYKDDQEGYEVGQHCILPHDGVRHGPSISWFGPGRPKAVGPYIGGKRNGWWLQWKRNGEKSRAWLYVNGDPVKGEE
jgi:hypothetical protein